MFVYKGLFLGAGESKSYKADDQLSKAIVAKQGATDEASIKEYAKIAGAMGAAAVCAAYGAAAAAPVCAMIGGTVVGWVADKVPIAQGSTIADTVADTWKSWVSPNLKWSQRAMLGVKAYYVMRDEVVSKAIDAGATEKWAESYLDSHGLGLMPSPGRWAPRSERYNHPLVCASEPCATAKDLVDASVWKECGVMGIDCRTYAQLVYGPWPPVAAKGEKIDWGLIAWDEIVIERKMAMKGLCNMNAFGGKSVAISCPSERPSVWARDQILRLSKVEAKMLYDLKHPTVAPTSSPAATLVKVGAGAGLLWGLLKLVKVL